FERRGRLVENKDATAPVQRLGDGHELAFGKTQRSDRRPRVRREIELSEHVARLLAHAPTIDRREGAEASHRKVPKGDVFRNRERWDEAQLLRDGHDAGSDRVARAREIAFFAVNSNDAAVRTMHTSEDADQSGFTGAVLADDRMDFAEGHSKVDAVQRHGRAESFADALSARGRVDHRINAARTAPACSGRSA